MIRLAASFVLAFFLAALAVVGAAMLGGCSQVPGAPMINVGTVTETQGSSIGAPAAPVPPAAPSRPASPAEPEPETPGVPRNCGLPCKAS